MIDHPLENWILCIQPSFIFLSIVLCSDILGLTQAMLWAIAITLNSFGFLTAAFIPNSFEVFSHKVCNFGSGFHDSFLLLTF